MELNVIEDGNEKLRIEVQGETHTLLNALRENAWKSGAEQASYMIEHPYMSQPIITIRAKNPKKVLVASAQVLSDDSKEFVTAFNRAWKK